MVPLENSQEYVLFWCIKKNAKRRFQLCSLNVGKFRQRWYACITQWLLFNRFMETLGLTSSIGQTWQILLFVLYIAFVYGIWDLLLLVHVVKMYKKGLKINIKQYLLKHTQLWEISLCLENIYLVGMQINFNKIMHFNATECVLLVFYSDSFSIF